MHIYQYVIVDFMHSVPTAGVSVNFSDEHKLTGSLATHLRKNKPRLCGISRPYIYIDRDSRPTIARVIHTKGIFVDYSTYN